MKIKTNQNPQSGMIKFLIGSIWLKLTGWKVKNDATSFKKYILIGAPHTSNWDFPITLATVFALRTKISWMAKDSLFKKPFGALMRSLGGIAIDRANAKDVVGETVKTFNQHDKLVIAIAPSGTRKKVDFWKSGFYRIAVDANIAICCGYLDYKRKEGGFGLTFLPSGDVIQDMNRIRDFYKGIEGKYPEKTSTIRLKSEMES
jgi:1-acyl-sn-glycerol-3-phosphate acyltransferase